MRSCATAPYPMTTPASAGCDLFHLATPVCSHRPAGGVLKVCVVGAGAIGAFMGVQLAQADCEVSLVARGQHLDAMRDRGLRLQIDGTERTARLPCSDRPADFGIQDYVIVAVK